MLTIFMADEWPRPFISHKLAPHLTLDNTRILAGSVHVQLCQAALWGEHGVFGFVGGFANLVGDLW
jgi:hypothetical protein